MHRCRLTDAGKRYRNGCRLQAYRYSLRQITADAAEMSGGIRSDAQIERAIFVHNADFYAYHGTFCAENCYVNKGNSDSMRSVQDAGGK